MTSDENPADVIEQAAKVIEASHRSMFDEMRAAGVKHESGVHRVFARYARALHAAHLLADPADRDERKHHPKCFTQRPEGAEHRDICDCRTLWTIEGAQAANARADRDEAYRKGFYAGADAIIRDELADPADKANEAFTWRERALHWKADKERAEAEVAELRATVERVRALINDPEAGSLRHHANGDFTWVIEITALNAALDGAGESE